MASVSGVPETTERWREVAEAVREARTFETGATRDTDNGKLDYEGFLSPAVLRRYAEFMHKNRVQSDGKLRDSDNWQKGIPQTVYMKSMMRHFMAVWTAHREGTLADNSEELYALMFNVMGMAFELEREERKRFPHNGSMAALVDKLTVGPNRPTRSALDERSHF